MEDEDAPNADADSVLTDPLDGPVAETVKVELKPYVPDIVIESSVPRELSNRFRDWDALVKSVSPGPNVTV